MGTERALASGGPVNVLLAVSFQVSVGILRVFSVVFFSPESTAASYTGSHGGTVEFCLSWQIICLPTVILEMLKKGSCSAVERLCDCLPWPRAAVLLWSLLGLGSIAVPSQFPGLVPDPPPLSAYHPVDSVPSTSLRSLLLALP